LPGKEEAIAKGDTNIAIDIMEKRKPQYPDFFFDYEVEKKGCFKHIFWYFMNRYGMPFISFVELYNHYLMGHCFVQVLLVLSSSENPVYDARFFHIS
jgi:hypothetical protein